jgi:hypothetical protein
MKRRQLKTRIHTLLQECEWPEIAIKLSQFDEKECVHHLFSGLCHRSEICKWHAVSGFGIVVSGLAEDDMESARIVMRRLLWSLNDESGGIGWGAPEAMAEIMGSDRRLFEEYCHMLISYMREDGPEPFQDGNYLELPALQRGVLWGVLRLLNLCHDEMMERKIAEDLRKYLTSDDSIVQTMAALCLGVCGEKQDIVQLDQLEVKPVTFNFYWDHILQEKDTVSLVQDGLENLQQRCTRLEK